MNTRNIAIIVGAVAFVGGLTGGYTGNKLATGTTLSQIPVSLVAEDESGEVRRCISDIAPLRTEVVYEVTDRRFRNKDGGPISTTVITEDGCGIYAKIWELHVLPIGTKFKIRPNAPTVAEGLEIIET